MENNMVNNNGKFDEYQERFNAIVEGQIIYNLEGSKQYVFSTRYNWRAAWSDSKTLAHKQLPLYWFVNEIGEVVSMAYSTRPVFVAPDLYKDSKYPRYHVTLENGRTKSISVHNLSGLVWDVPVSKEVEALLNTKGLYAFGTRNDDINGHHIDGDITNNHYSNIQFLIKKRHSFMHYKKYEQLADSVSTPVAIETPYLYNSNGSFKEHSGHNKLLEFRSTQDLLDYLSSTEIYITEALLEIDGSKYLIKPTDNN